MHLSDLKKLHVSQLLDMALALEVDNAHRMRKQELMFAILKKKARQGEQIFGDGTLEVLPDGFGFLRSPDTSYLASTDDIYISPSQIRRFNLHTGDSIEGEVRTPKDGERYFALVRVDTVNGLPPESTKHRMLFENLTPIFPNEPLTLERDMRGDENITGRIIDIIAPIGKGQRARGASEERQDRAHAAHRARHHDELPRHHALRASHRRTSGRSDGNAALRPRRSRRVDLRRTRRASRAGGRNGDRKGQAPHRIQEGRRHSARSRVSPAPTTR